VHRVAVLAGDGVGPEVVDAALAVVDEVGARHGFRVERSEGLIGGAAIDATGTALPDGVLETCRAADAVLLGAVGGPRWDDPRAAVRPEQGLLGLRKGLGLYANLRPVRVYDALAQFSTLREEVIIGTDFVTVRELTGGLYFGQPQGRQGEPPNRSAVDTCAYTEAEVERVARVAFELARSRRRRVCSVDKQNVLATSRLWREVVTEVGRDYPEVTLTHQLVDSAAMLLVRDPRQFDVLLTENLFGDILSDEAAMIAGSMGMLPSASLGGDGEGGGRRFGLYEPVHGSAPDIAGQGVVNPLAAILSAALMLRVSLDESEAADAVEYAVDQAINLGARTRDLGADDDRALSTAEMTERVLDLLGLAGGQPPDRPRAEPAAKRSSPLARLRR
jgi:3-isopropylmalate dehydrogenase